MEIVDDALLMRFVKDDSNIIPRFKDDFYRSKGMGETEQRDKKVQTSNYNIN